MKRTLLFFLILFNSLSGLFAVEPPFYIERLNCDFNGVVANEDIIICYGNHGIMTWSRDNGHTWGQTNIGDKHDIYKIENIKGVFYGVTSYSIIISTDSGKSWENTEIADGPDIRAMTISGDKMYILTKRSLLSRGLGLEESPVELSDLDTLPEYHQIAADEEYLYINADNYNILKYEKNGGFVNNIEINYEDFCYACGNNFYIKTIDNELYILLKSLNPQKLCAYRNTLWKSADGAASWERVSGDIMTTTVYSRKNDEIYFIYPESKNSLFSHNYSKINQIGEVERLNHPDKDQRCIYYYGYHNTVEYTDIAEIGNKLIIAVGKDKLISISRDGGKNWELISYFESFYIRGFSCFDNNFIYINDKLIYCVSGYKEPLFITTNGGITWLPQKYYKLGDSREAQNFFFNSSGDGFLKYVTINHADSNTVTVSNNGNKVELINNDPFYHDEEISKRFNYNRNNRKGLHLGDKVLFFFTECWAGQHCTGFLARYDEVGNFIDSAQFCDLILRNVIAANDSVVFVLGYQMEGENRFESPDDTNSFTFYYQMLKSTDRGMTWDSISPNPFYAKFGLNNNKTYYEYQAMLNSQPYLTGNKIHYLTYDSLIYIYDVETGSFDSVNVCADLSSFDNAYFKFNKRDFIISERNTIYFADGLRSKAEEWDSLEAGALFSGWDYYYDAITSPLIINDTTGFLCIGNNSSSSWHYELNLVKLHTRKINAVEEPQTEEFIYYKWTSPPWPMPASGIVRTNYYWDSKSKLEDAVFGVWDVSGDRIEKKVNVERISNYGAELSVDFSDMQAGIYIITISLYGESRAVPVVIMR